MLVSVKNLNSSCCVSVTGASTRGTRQDMSHIFHREDKGTGFVYDTIFANADFWRCVVQMYGLCCRP